jgi:hypothetical protein
MRMPVGRVGQELQDQASSVEDERQRLLEMLKEGLASLEAGRVVSREEYDRMMEAVLQGCPPALAAKARRR